jgi:NitT/TauT family transport system substrate-binding protein
MKKTLAILCLLTSWLAFFNEAQAQKLVIAWTSVSAFNSPFWVMPDAGFYKQEGLDVETIFILSSPTAAKATLAGDISISAQNSQVVADSGLAGGDLVSIGAVVNMVPFYMMAIPEVKTVADLKGKSVGISRFGAASDFGTRMFLTKHGVEPNKEVAFVQIGGQPEIAAALSKKLIAGAAMSQPMAAVAEQQGAHLLANMVNDEIPFVHLSITTTKRFVRERRPVVKAFLRAYARSVHFIYTRKEETLAIFQKYTKVKDPKILNATLQYGYEFMEKIPLVKRAGFQVTLDEIARTNPKAKQAKPEQFYDNSIVQELIDEGFFTKLWGKSSR